MTKLKLSRETLRQLDSDDSARVVGGRLVQTGNWNCPSIFNLCTAPPMTQQATCTIVFSAYRC